MAQAFSTSQYQQIVAIQRSLGILRFEAVLGDGSGLIFDPESGGAKVYVRFQTGNTLGKPVSVRKPQLKTAIDDGTPVWVGFDEDEELVVTGPRVGAQIAVGDNPVINDKHDDPTGGFLDLSMALPLRSQPTPQPSMSVSVKSLWYMNGSSPVFFSGNNAFDLTSFVPGTAGKQCLALVYLDKTDNTIHGVASTPISTAKGLAAFGAGDIEECVAAAGDDAIHSKFWQVTNGMTEIVTANSYLDFRHWLQPLSTATGGAASTDLSPLILSGWT